MVSISSGTEINLYIDWGDETSEEHYLEQSTDVAASYGHNYTAVGDYQVTVRASNDKNSLEETLTAGVDIRIRNVNYSLEHAEVGGEVQHFISADEGSRISVFLNHGDGNVLERYYENSSLLPSSTPITKAYGNGPEIYNVTLRVSNALDVFTFEVEAAVNQRIKDLDVTFDRLVNIRDGPIVFMQTITAGSHMTCGRYFGDDILWIVQEDNPSLSETYDHTYLTAGVYDFVLRCYNYLDYFIFISNPIFVQYPIEGAFVNLTNETEVGVALGSSLSIPFCFANGTNVSCSVTFNNETDNGNLMYTATVVGPSCGSYDRVEDLPSGIHQVEINCSNLISNHTFEITVFVVEAIGGLNFSNDPVYSEPGKEVEFLVNLTTGASVTLNIDFGDGSMIEEKIINSEGGPSETNVTHVYHNPGYFRPSVTATNRISLQNDTTFIGIENTVNDTLELSAVNVTSVSDQVKFIIVHPVAEIPAADGIRVAWNYTENGEPSFEESAKITHAERYEHLYSASAYGDFTACAKIYNNVSSVVKCAPYRVGVPLRGFNCTNLYPPYEFGQEVTFVCQSDQGSTVQYKLDYGDGTIETVNRTSKNWTNPDITSINHTYTDPGVYTVMFEAIGNSFVSFLEDTVDISILKPVGEVYLLCNKRFVSLGDSIDCEARVSAGSLVRSQVNFSDNTVTALKRHPLFDASANGIQFKHTFIEAGNYTAYAMSENDISSNLSTGIRVGDSIAYNFVVQQKITSISLLVDPNPIKMPDGVVHSTISTEQYNFPTDIFCSFILPGDQVYVVYAPELMSENSVEYSKTVPSDVVGTHTVSFNCSNLVSFATSEVDITFIQTIVNPKVEIVNPYVKEEHGAVIELSTEKGSHHSFEIYYGDDTSKTIASSGAAWLNGSIPVEANHIYVSAYNYTIRVRVFNELSEETVTATEHVIVQKDLSQAPLTLSSDGPVGFPPGAVEYTVSSTDTSNVYSNLWFKWEFADKIEEGAQEYGGTVSEESGYKKRYEFTGTHGGEVTSQVNVSNQVSFTVLQVSVKILETIEGVVVTTTENTSAFPTGEGVNLNCSCLKGTEVQFSLNAGDESNELNSASKDAESFHLFTYAYALPESYEAVCTVTNAVSSAFKEVTVIIQNVVDIEDLRFDYKPSVMISNDTKTASFKLTIDTGSTVPSAVFAHIDPGDGSEPQTKENLHFPFQYTHVYDGTVIGKPAVNVTLHNLVSKGTKILELQLEQEIVGLTLDAPAVIVTGFPANITVSLEFGSHYTVTLKFGDGMIHDIKNDDPVYFLQKDHTYSAAGKYVVEVSAHNDVMLAMVSVPSQEIIVQNEVPDIEIKSDTVIPVADGPNFKLVVDKLDAKANSPTDASITINFGDLSLPVISSISLDSVFEKQHVYSTHGEYTVTVNVSNAVSFKTASHVVIVEEAIANLDVQIQDKTGQTFTDGEGIVINKLMVFTATYTAGTNVALTWKLDNTLMGNTSKMEHRFSSPGDIQLDLIAQNGLGEATLVIKNIVVIADSDIESFVYKNNTMVGKDVLFTVKLKKNIDNVCFELQASISTIMLRKWFGPTQSSCEGQADFDPLQFHQSDSPSQNYEYSMTFDVQGTYSIILTMISADRPMTLYDRDMPVEVYARPCHSPSLSLFNISTGTKENPLLYLKGNEINVPDVGYNLELNCEATQNVSTTWRMFSINEHGVEIEVNPTGDLYEAEIYIDRLVFPKQSVPYGQYKFIVTVNMAEFPFKSAMLEFYIKVGKSDLLTSLPSYQRVGHGKDFLITVEDAVTDPDDFTNSLDGITFEWYCGMMPYQNGSCPPGVSSCDDNLTVEYINKTNKNEIMDVSIPRTVPEPFDEERNSFSGCFGEGPGRLDLSNQAEKYLLSFNTGHLLPSGLYTVVLWVRKDTRETWNTMHLEIMSGNLPSFSIECFTSVRGYASYCRDDSYYISAKQPYYMEIKCPTCPADRTIFEVEVFLQEHNRLRKELASSDGKKRNTTLAKSVKQLQVEGYHVIYIPADTMPLGYEVTLEVSSKISGMADGKQSVTIVTSGLPITGTFDVQPRSGEELVTEFDLSHSDWYPYDLNSQLQFEYEVCVVERDDSEDCSPILIPSKTNMVPGREDNGFKVRVKLNVSDEYSNVVSSKPVELHVKKANDTARENALDSIDVNSNPTVALNSFMTIAAGLGIADADSTSGTDGGSGGTDGSSGGTDGENQGQAAVEKQQVLARVMERVTDMVLENEDKVALSPEVKLQALAAFSTLSKKMSKNISVEATLDAVDFIENIGDTVNLDAMDPDTLEKTSNNMLKVLGSVGRTMEQEVEVEKEEEVDPESIPDEEAEDKAKEEQASQKQKIKENALKASKAFEETVAKIAKSGREALISDQKEVRYGNDEMQVTLQKASAIMLSNVSVRGPEFDVVMPIIPDIDEPIFNEMTYVKGNLFTFEESAVAVNTGVQSVRTVDAYDQFIDLGISPDNPFKISYPTSGGDENWADMSNITADSITNLYYFYVPVEVNNSAYSSCLDSSDPSVYFQIYIKFDVTPDSLLKPNQTEGEYDLTVKIPDLENSDTSNPYCYLVPQARITSPGFFVGLDILHTNDSGTRHRRSDRGNGTEPDIKMNAVLSRCRAWDSEQLQWVEDKCTVGSRSSPGSIQCECHEVSPSVNKFAGGVTVPKVNSINFQNVFSNFASLLSANPTVFATIISLLVLYCLLVIWARHSDKKDLKKWGVSPLVDNKNHQDHFYKVSIFTGLRKGAGTKSKVCFILSGEKGDTGVRIADDGKGQFYKRGSVRHFVMSTDFDVGPPTFLRIWHDNSGKSEFASWYLDKVVIEDLRTKTGHFFLCSRWLAADEDDGQVDRMLPVAGTEEIQGFNHLFFAKARKNLTDDHLWVSLFSRPTKSNFTRVQRLTCCLSLLFTTMLANAMFFRTSDEQRDDEGNADTRIHIGFIILSLNSILTSIFGSLIALPVNILIVQFFRKSKPKHWQEEDEDELMQAKKQANRKVSSQKRTAKGNKNPPKKKKVPIWKKKYPFPRFCTYVGWCLAIISIMVSAFFVILYSLEWGETKSLEWLSALVFSFFQSVALIQPVKIIFLAAVLSLLFRTLDELDDDRENKEVNAKPQEDEELDDPIIRLQQAPIAYIPKPPSKKKLEAAKKSREFEKKMWNIVKEVLYYFLFLLLISFIAWGTKDDIVYKMNEHIKEVINTGALHGDEIRDGHALWKWLRDTAVPSIFYDEKYTGQPTTVRDRMFMSDMVSFRVGAVRLRQLRIPPALCDRPKVVEDIIVECNIGYSLTKEEDRNFTTGWYLDVNNSESNLQNHEITPLQKAYKYFSIFDLKGLPYWGKMSAYGGGGYVADLGTSSYRARKLIDSLIEHNWIDHYTRAVFLEFTVYNPGLNLFAFVNYLMELPSAGSVQPSDRITSFQVYSVVAGMGAMVVAAQLVYCVVLIYFIVREIMKFRKERKAYWKDPWNWLEFSVIVGSIVAIAMFALREKFGRIVMNQLKKDTNQFTNYSALSLYNENIDYLVGFLVFLANVKFLKLLRFNKHVSEFSATIRYAGKDLFYFAITFAILFTAFAIWGYVIFGKTLYTFSTYIYTLETMLSMLLGKFEFNNMEDSYKYLGKIYFMSFTIMVFFIVINMLLGIITMAYEEARSTPQDPMADYKVFGFLWKKIRRALHLKVKSEEHGEGYMTYTDTIDMRLSALDQHITHMYREYLQSKKKEYKADTQIEETLQKDEKAHCKSTLKALQQFKSKETGGEKY